MSKSMKILLEQYIARLQEIYGSHLRKVILYGRGCFVWSSLIRMWVKEKEE